MYYNSQGSVLEENVFSVRWTTQAIPFNTFILKDLLVDTPPRLMNETISDTSHILRFVCSQQYHLLKTMVEHNCNTASVKTLENTLCVVLLTSVINLLHLHQTKFKLKMPLQIFHNPLNLFAVGRAWHLFLAHPHRLATFHKFAVLQNHLCGTKISYRDN